MTYYELLRHVFKRFSLRAAPQTLFPTLALQFLAPTLSASRKPALFTMNILPPMATVWYHFARKYLGETVDITIFDCSGKLDRREFPGAGVYKFLNLYAATKSEFFLRNFAQKRRSAWLCDDDMFFIERGAVDVVEREMQIPRTASVSFRPRRWWSFNVNGVTYPASSSYCTAINREIFVREGLSLAPCDGNPHATIFGKPAGRYDTFDKANEILLRKGYRCVVVPEGERYVTGFSGISGAVMLLSYFKTPEQTLAYFRDPPDEAWKGNVLFGVLAAMLAICTIQELYTVLVGRPYPLSSLPRREDLERLREAKKPFLGAQHDVEWFDAVAATLRAKI